MPVILATQETDQKDQGSNPAWANSFQDPISKKPVIRKRAGGVAQVVELLPCPLSRNPSLPLRSNLLMEGVNLTKILCKHFCKCHSVPLVQQ
jgi:hypothetical protein